jgi:Do/DeqQ family serine protease
MDGCYLGSKMKNTWLFVMAFILAFFIIAPPGIAQTVPLSRTQITLSYAPLVKQVAPAVVNIYTRRVVKQRLSPLFEDPLFRQFFGGALPPGFSRQRMENSLGSGVIVKADGLIVTSNHVIAGADQIRVVLYDRREFDAVVVTVDEHSDLAILRIDPKGQNFPFMELKDSDDAQIGDLVLAIGDPFGVGQTVTSGIISAVSHASVGSGDLNYFIQTDAAINPGNSGGALVTMDGKLVGINAAIYSQSGGNLGIGFAVPSNIVRVVLNAVASGKKNIVRPWLGIDGQEVTPELAASLNMAQPSGYLVTSIHSGSPAANAGLHAGDVIVSVNGREINDPESFRYRVGTLPIGSDVSFGVVHKGQKSDIQLSLIAPPEEPPRGTTVISGRNPFAGATVENISPAVNEETGFTNIERGVIVFNIKDDSVAANMGLQPGDVILTVNGTKMMTVSDVQNVIKQPFARWVISIQRGEDVLTISVGQ